MTSPERYDDEIADFTPSDSDDDYDESEKQLLKKFKNQRREDSDSENEVLAVRSGDSSDDDKSDLALSDIEGKEDDDLPDVRAWGKDKKRYYKTDYVDQDYGGFQGKDAHLAELEEEEARNLQKQLATQLDDLDFELEFFDKKKFGVEDRQDVEEVVKADISKLSKRQKMQILEKESPEFFSLVGDFKVKLTIAKHYLIPILAKHKSGEISDSAAIEFVRNHYCAILNYCMNIYMYLYLKSSKVNVQNHPVIKRLYQYRQLFLKLEPVFQETVKPQIEMLLSGDVKKATKTLKLLSKLTKNIEPTVERAKLELSLPDDEDEGVLEEEQSEAAAKRAITYEMAKNKGLTPYRKKELRNPRVKHKLKYRKAMIRRKGAVREPRKELTRYSGEISGIKATVSKSIKLKT